jgi:hypothetical protein
VSELVGHALAPRRDSFVLALELHEAVLVVAVEDGSAVLPDSRRDDPDAESAPGPPSIEALRLRRGVADHHGGQRARAELALPAGQR